MILSSLKRLKRYLRYFLVISNVEDQSLIICYSVLVLYLHFRTILRETIPMLYDKTLHLLEEAVNFPKSNLPIFRPASSPARRYFRW